MAESNTPSKRDADEAGIPQQAPKNKAERSSNDHNSNESQVTPHPFLPLSPSQFMRHPSEMGGALKLTGELPAQLVIQEAGNGLVTFVKVQEYGKSTAKFSNPIDRAAECKQEDPEYVANKAFVDAVGLMVVCPQRISKEINAPRLTERNEKGARYKQMIYGTYLEDKSPASKREHLEKFRSFLTFHGIKVEIKPFFDETDLTMQSLDHYIEDKYVLRLHQLVYKRGTDPHFYKRSTAITRAAFFSPPYPVESNTIGYPVAVAQPQDATPVQAPVSPISPGSTSTAPQFAAYDTSNTGERDANGNNKNPICVD